MYLASTILGATAVKQLQASSGAFVLQVGSDRLTRAQLAAVGCFNFTAARNLSAVLKDFSVKSLADLYARVPPTAVAVPHMGAISLAVLGAAFEAKGIGGESPLESWVRKHAAGSSAERTMVTFHTLKQRELDVRAEEKKTAKRRKRARQHQAHETRVERFTARHAASA